MDLTNEPREILSGNDNIVIKDIFETIAGGRTLDVTGFTPDVIEAGHVVIQDNATKKYKPAPVTGDEYSALPASHTVVGIVVATVSKNRAFAGIMVRGTVNIKVAPYKLEANTTLLTAVKTALPLVRFTHDKA